MGLGMEDSIIQQITTLTQKLSKMRSQKERRMSQYACSTSDQTTSKGDSIPRLRTATHEFVCQTLDVTLWHPYPVMSRETVIEEV